MINWKVRVKNKWFWLALIPAVLILIRAVAALFGFALDLTETGDKLAAVVEAIFTVLAILGIVVDPTTEGVQDSMLAMTYKTPKPYAAYAVPTVDTEYQGLHDNLNVGNK